MKACLQHASLRRICWLLGVSRSSLECRRTRMGRRSSDERDALTARIHELIQQHPTYGYRRIWALLRFGEGLQINKKAVYRRMKANGWMVHQRMPMAKPRVRSSRSIASRSDERWATDVTHVPAGRDGWGHLAVVIDCHDREIIGWEFALRSRAKEAERALEAACLRRFGTLRPEGPKPVLRSDNGLIFQSSKFRAACRDYGITQEYITPYTPEQNGLVERFFRSLKEECTWQNRYASFEEAQRSIARWIRWYNHERPHSSLGYKSPRHYRSHQTQEVA